MTDGRTVPTGDTAVDAVLSGLEGAGDLGPAEEIEAYRAALDGLGRLLEEQPRMPGAG
ncbi:hypothetical protein [Citricoccus sp. SGAir0253]|uniref:hypothetical protein n=1 Tax=Citricoccus sp. SGAir0253 TaxID=2567881 RepID=UPI00143DD1FB|nr:hypothetical protein [Citricoccus sp. SGAir0253]